MPAKNSSAVPEPTYAEVAKVILPFLEGEDRILAAYLLGSAVTGRMRADSDIDLALLMFPGRRMGSLERGDLAAAIAFEIGRDVDIGMLESMNLVYAKEAILTGRRVFDRDPARTDVAETALLGMYAAFNEDRREVLDAYRA
jgi:uncharacterized protein